MTFLSFLLAAGGVYFYQMEKEARYNGMSIVPERTKDIPLFNGLQPGGGPSYMIEGRHWEEILNYYKEVLPENGWTEVFIHASSNLEEDGAGFMSTWIKPGQNWELAIDAGYFKQNNRTQVIFDKKSISTATEWIKESPKEICIKFKVEVYYECIKLTDTHSNKQIAELVNSALDWEKERIPYSGKSMIDIDSFKVEVYYDLEKGIYLVSNKGTKWMKPEQEFFMLTRISKEY
ncbi:MAG TPA: hypothetical protein DCR24_08885 [Bacillus bacterium]|nr:hypothetical protein [Bacillus sp. (in: firmicutes)]